MWGGGCWVVILNRVDRVWVALTRRPLIKDLKEGGEPCGWIGGQSHSVEVFRCVDPSFCPCRVYLFILFHCVDGVWEGNGHKC